MSDTLYTRLTADLRTAMRDRDKVAVSALRTLIGTIDNAGAVSLDHDPGPSVGRSGDVPRRELDEEQVRDLIRTELAEVESALAEYIELDHQERAGVLRHHGDVLRRYLA